MVPPRSRRSNPEPAGTPGTGSTPTPADPAGAPGSSPYASPPIDPDLLAQLDDAEGSGESVAAVVAIRRRVGRKPEPDAIRATLDAALARVAELTSSSPADVNVMAYMASAYVEASAVFVRTLLQQPEIVGAVAAKPRSDASGGTTAS